MSDKLMLKFLGKSPENTGQAQEEVKKKKTEEQKIENAKLYEKDKRVRKYQASWENEFDWLIYDNKGKVFCKFCRSLYGPIGELATKKMKLGHSIDHNNNTKLASGPLVVGCSNLKKYVLSQHDQSKGHKEAKIKFELRHKLPGNSEAEKMLENLNKSIFDKLSNLVRNAHAIAKSSRPFTDFVWMADLDEKKGITLGNTYRNDKSCREFIQAIAGVEKQKVIEQLDQAKFLTVLSDGSTDVSTIENEIVYVRFSVKGEITNSFVGIFSVEKADAKGIFGCLKKALGSVSSANSSALEKVVAYCSDGASVNTGETGGVIALLRQEVWNNVLLIKCLVHRLELSFKDGIKGVKVCDKLLAMLSSLYSFYHVSPLQRANLKNSFKALNKSPVMPLRVGGTRWVSHTALAIERLWEGYPAIVLHLSQESQDGKSSVKPKAQALQKLLKTRSIITFGHFLHDVLNILKSLSLDLQREDATAYDCHKKLEVTMEALKKMKTNPGFHLRQVKDTSDFKGHKLDGNLSMHDAGMPKVIDSMLASLTRRYADTTEEGAILNATKIANFKLWPVESRESFGDADIVVLVDHFADMLQKAGTNTELVELEWTSLKHSIYDNHNPHEITWREVNAAYMEGHSNVLSLIDLVLSLPASTASCERGFSQMKIIKNDYRNRLTSSTMTDLLTVKMISLDVKSFDPLPAVHYFHQGRHRRPIFSDRKGATPVASCAAAAADETVEDDHGHEAEDGEQNTAYSDYESDYESDYSASDIDIENIANDED